MWSLRLLIREICHRFPGFFLGFLAVVAAVALYVGLETMGRASYRETKRLMRNLGFNLLIVPEGTDMADFWAADFASGDMPEQYVRRLAESPGMLADHYVATLQKKVLWEGREVLLTGILPERSAIDARKKAPMGYSIARGECYVGYAIAKSPGIEPGKTINVLGKDLTVARRLLEDGSKQDIRIYAHLHDVQDILDMKGRINAIEALHCLCAGASLPDLKQQIAKVLPGTRVTELRDIAAARSETRKMVEQHVELIVAVVLVVCAAWIAFLALLNVRERRQEIGILRALGFGSGHIAALFLGRAILMGLLGALAGFFVGTAVAMHYGPDMFKLTFSAVRPPYDIFIPTLLVAPLIAALAAMLPAVIAISQDPAVVLREE